MAAFLTRTYSYVTGGNLTPAGACFGDVGSHPLHRAIDTLCMAGVVRGTSGGGYVPSAPVKRDAMGSFLTRLLDLLAAEGAGPPA